MCAVGAWKSENRGPKSEGGPKSRIRSADGTGCGRIQKVAASEVWSSAFRRWRFSSRRRSQFLLDALPPEGGTPYLSDIVGLVSFCPVCGGEPCLPESGEARLFEWKFGEIWEMAGVFEWKESEISETRRGGKGTGRPRMDTNRHEWEGP